MEQLAQRMTLWNETKSVPVSKEQARVAQMIVKDYLEPRFEKVFSRCSYGYRPGKNAHQALSAVRENCRQNDWVIDLGIKGFFDNINHQKLWLAIDKHVSEKWVKTYITRWLTAPVQKNSGDITIFKFEMSFCTDSRLAVILNRIKYKSTIL